MAQPAQYAAGQVLCNGTVSVRLSIPAWAYGSKPAATGLLLWAQYRSIAGRPAFGGERGQFHVVSVRSR